MDSQNIQLKLNIPAQTLGRLSFCAGNIDSLNLWVKNLPIANTGEAARSLFLAIREISQWQADPLLRFKFLEALRPSIYTVCSQLTRHFLQSSVSLSEKQLKIANLGQALLKYLATGYKMVIAHSLELPKTVANERPGKVVTMSVHRAISELSSSLLACYQLYWTPAEHNWLEINQLFWFAEQNDLLDFKIEDRVLSGTQQPTIRDIFIRVHLLAIAKPSNLSQYDINLLYQTCKQWAQFVSITAYDDESALFMINLQRDQAAQYRQEVSEIQKATFRGINTSRLVHELKMWLTGPESKHQIEVPSNLSENLLIHAIQSWGIHWQRTFRRATTEGSIKLSLGLTATHYYCSDRIDFDSILANLKPVDADLNPFARKTATEDGWSQAFDAEGSSYREASDINFDVVDFLNKNQGNSTVQQRPDLYPTYSVSLVNSSPSGYCIRWTGDIPSNAQVGELLGIQEQDAQHWSIGVIRWVQFVNKQESLFGIELIAPHADVAAVRLLQKVGNTHAYTQALLLPAIKAISQPMTLIAQRIPFSAGNKIELLHSQLKGRFQLTKRLISTNSFSQFQFKETGLMATAENEKNTNDEFDAIWGKL